MNILKLIVLQCFWFGSIKYGQNLFLPLSGLLLFIFDFLTFRKTENLKISYLAFSFILVISGIAMDKVINYLNILEWGDRFYPTELIGVWLIFPCYYYYFFKKFQKPKWLPFLIGAIFGPLAYYSGANISSNIMLSEYTLNIILLGSIWGTFFWFSNLLYLYFEKRARK